jgi:hypothetical protein
MKTSLHIIAFDNPFPPDYGGAIDVFYKLKALKQAGAEPVLHLFSYGRNHIEPLRKWTRKVYVYPRKRHFKQWLSHTPFIVKSRLNKDLLKHLMKDDLPVLFEGIHTTGYAPFISNKHSLFLRAHNIETLYYKYLAENEKRWQHKIFLASESKKLNKYEPRIAGLMQKILAIHPDETRYFSKFAPSEWLPVFHPFDRVKLHPETLNYILFHGNLSVSENIRSVEFLWNKILKNLPYTFVVAGKNPAPPLQKLARIEARFKLIANPDINRMNDLVEKARVNLIYTPRKSGIKLKLLHSLHRGKNIICNTPAIENTKLETLVSIADEPQSIQNKIRKAMENPLPDFDETVQTRTSIIRKYYDNTYNALKLLEHVRPS